MFSCSLINMRSTCSFLNEPEGGGIICSSLNYVCSTDRGWIAPWNSTALRSAAVTPAAPVFRILLASTPTQSTHKRTGARRQATGHHKPPPPLLRQSPRRFGPFSFPWGDGTGLRRRAQLQGSGTAGSCKLNSGDCTTVVRSG
jgi:hypothetical protein